MTDPSVGGTATVLVTGAAGSIGRRLAAAYADDGHEVHLVDVAPEVTDVAAELGGVAHVLDVTDDDAVATLGSLARLDVLVNGVGAWPLLSLDELTPAHWRRSMDLNLTSAYAVTWACRAALVAAGGAVVNISSAIALKGHPLLAHYAAAKAGLIGATRSLAQALGPHGVRVNAVAPGLLAEETATTQWTPEQRAAFRAARALPLEITAQDVLTAVRFLTGPGARAITGQTLVVDGGTVLH